MSKKILENNANDKKISVKKIVRNKVSNKSKLIDDTASAAVLVNPAIVNKDSTNSKNIKENSAVLTIALPIGGPVCHDSIKVNTNMLNLYDDVSVEKSFILCDGRLIRNCKELADLLIILDDDVFFYHVTENKNDFSNWVNDVFCNDDLAKKISLIKNKLIMSVEIYRYMFELLKK